MGADLATRRLAWLRVICLARPALFAKIFRFRRRANHLYKLAPSCTRQRGVSRSSRTLGAGCDGRGGVARRTTPIRLR